MCKKKITKTKNAQNNSKFKLVLAIMFVENKFKFEIVSSIFCLRYFFLQANLKFHKIEKYHKNVNISRIISFFNYFGGFKGV